MAILPYPGAASSPLYKRGGQEFLCLPGDANASPGVADTACTASLQRRASIKIPGRGAPAKSTDSWKKWLGDLDPKAHNGY